jgi:short-subunit dehydrogenase
VIAVTARRTVLVSGASSGIGAATARQLRAPDVHLVLVARRAERLTALADELGGATVIAGDLTDPGFAGRVADEVASGSGRLDLLVNNAGAHFSGSFADTGWDNVRRSMALNFEAHVRLTEALLPLLRASAPSTVVNIASVAGRIGLAQSGAYSAAKFAMCGWTEALHAEERPHGVHVALVLPGYVATEGFPHARRRASRAGRWTVSTDVAVARAVDQVVRRGSSERYVPRSWRLLVASRRAVPGLHAAAEAALDPGGHEAALSTRMHAEAAS